MMETVVSTASAVLPLWQQRRQHDEALHISNELHKQAIDLNQTFHMEEMVQNEQLFSKDCALERELHYGQMSHDFDIARREGVRDAWSQQSQLLQTLMIVDTLMFSSAYAMLVQGDPPDVSPMVLLRFYAAMLGLSMAFLFASVWCCLKLQTRLSHYNMHRQDVVYICGKQHRYFREYYTCHCKHLAKLAFVCFYLGTGTTLSSAAAYTFAKMYYDFSNLAAGVLFVCFSAVAVSLPFLAGFIDSWSQHASQHGDDQELDEAYAQAGVAQEAARHAPTSPQSTLSNSTSSSWGTSLSHEGPHDADPPHDESDDDADAQNGSPNNRSDARAVV